MPVLELSGDKGQELEESPEQQIARLQAEITELKRRLIVAEANAAFDSLTGIFNRRMIDEELTKEIAQFNRDGSTFAVVLMDLDEFKRLNDTQGHLKGDEMLREFAKRINKQMRASDVFGRWGGEEFLVILRLHPGATDEEVEEIIERYHNAITGLSRSGEASLLEQQTVSIGCVIVESGKKTSFDEVVSTVDRNLYRSKDGGRNQSTLTRL